MKLFDIWNDMATKRKFDRQHAVENIQELLSRYSEPRRKHRTIEHLNRIVVSIESYKKLLNTKEAVYLAAFYHDVVFDPRVENNVPECSRVARMQMAGMRVRATLLDEACRLIDLTDHVSKIEEEDVDAKVLLDCDILCFSDDAGAYATYRENLRSELSFLSDDEFKARRKEEIQRFLNRESIYLLEPIRDEYEKKARSNLEAELKSLK